MSKILNTRAGFTLLEMIGVIIIIASLAAISIPRVMKYAENAKVTAVVGDHKNLTTAVGSLYADSGKLTLSAGTAAADSATIISSGIGTNTLLEAKASDGTTAWTGWDGPYMNKEYTKTPWGDAATITTAYSTADTAVVASGVNCTLTGAVADTTVSTWVTLAGMTQAKADAIESKLDGNATADTAGQACYDATGKVMYLLLGDDRV